MNPGYDPKARRGRPRSDDGPSPIDAILGEDASREAVAPSEVSSRTVAKDSARPSVAKRLPDPVSPDPDVQLPESEQRAEPEVDSEVTSEVTSVSMAEPAPVVAPEPALPASAAESSTPPTSQSAASKPSVPLARTGEDGARSARTSRLASVAFVLALLAVALYLLRRRRS